jgi:hypothetical protein
LRYEHRGLQTVAAALGSGVRITKTGDGRRNPHSGEEVPVAEKTVLFFKAGKELRYRTREVAPAPLELPWVGDRSVDSFCGAHYGGGGGVIIALHKSETNLSF